MLARKWRLFDERTSDKKKSAASQGQTLSHNVVLSTPRHDRDSSSQR